MVQKGSMVVGNASRGGMRGKRVQFRAQSAKHQSLRARVEKGVGKGQRNM